jgi:hypothetical protein
MDLHLIDYIVKYQDGSTWRMSIESGAALTSDEAARAIADAKQLTAEIPQGKILRVVRAT